MLVVGLDTETGGLDPRVHSLLTVGIAIANITSEKIEWIFEKEFRVTNEILKVTAKALAVNGLDLTEFVPQGTRSLEQISREISTHVDAKVPIVGHNLDFDLGFTKGYPLGSGKKPRKKVDTYRVAQLLEACGCPYKRLTLEKCCSYHGIPWNASEAHGALYDAKKSVELFKEQLSIVKIGYQNSLETGEIKL